MPRTLLLSNILQSYNKILRSNCCSFGATIAGYGSNRRMCHTLAIFNVASVSDSFRECMAGNRKTSESQPPQLLTKVLLYKANLYCNAPLYCSRYPNLEESKSWKSCQYSSDLYCGMPPIYIAVCLEIISHYPSHLYHCVPPICIALAAAEQSTLRRAPSPAFFTKHWSNEILQRITNYF